MKNRFEIIGDDTLIFMNSSTYGPMSTVIDTSDLDKMDEFSGTWFPHWSETSRSFYVWGKMKSNCSKWVTVQLHRWLLEPKKGMEVDHKNSNRLDNRRNNLRVVTRSQNQQNVLAFTANNSSGCKGVSWHKPSKRWRVRLTINGKLMVIGYFTELQAAVQAALEARAKHLPFSKEAEKIDELEASMA